MQTQTFTSYLRRFLLLTSILVAYTAHAQLATPSLHLPINNDTGVVTCPFLFIRNVPLSANEIIYEYAENINMNNSTILSGNRTSSTHSVFALKLKLATDYYWRARVRNTTDSSAWTSIFKFTTGSKLTVDNPRNNIARLGSSSIDLRVHQVFGYDTVLFQIDTSTSFNSTEIRNISVPDTGTLYGVSTFQENIRYGVNYYWRARAYSGNQTTNWTDVRFFNTGDSISIKSPSPLLKQDVVTSFEFNVWNTTEPFQVQMSTSPSFASIAIDTVAANGTQNFSLTHLNYETTYYYRVRGVNSADSGAWSHSSFTTNGLGTDRIISPSSTNPTFAYRNRTSIAGSDGYQLDLDTSKTFDSPVARTRYTSDGKDTVADLLFGTLYYARARPYHRKDTGDWTLTKTIGIIANTTLYFPINNQTEIGINEEPQFGTRAGIDKYQLQFSAGTTFDTTLFLDTILGGFTQFGSSNFIKGLTFKYNTNYQWRIRGWHAKDTSAWSDVQRFTTRSSPILQRPFNSDFLGNQASLYLQWQTEGAGIGYQVMLDTTPSFSSPLLVDTVVDTNALAQENLLFRPLYYWKVRVATVNDTSAWSDTWKFKVLRPRLSSPRNNRTNVTVDFNSLDWNSIQGTDGYIVEIDSFSDFRAALVLSNTVKNSFFHYIYNSADLITFKTKYYWRVKLFHAKDTSEWSDVWNFTTLPRRAPALISPSDSSEQISVLADLVWEAYTGASSYVIEYSIASDFENATQVTSATTTARVGLNPETRYYWRARSRNSDGNEFYDWSEIWTFTTNQGLPAPVLTSPVDGATELNENVTLRWNKDDNALSYRVELSTDSTFSGSFAKTVNVASASFNEVRAERTYYWRVRINAQGITSSWSPKWHFTTAKTGSIATPEADHITAYPNPSTDYIILSGFEGKPTKIELLSTSGALLQTYTNEGRTSMTIAVNHLANGTYHAVLTQEGIRSKKTFVVNR